MRQHLYRIGIALLTLIVGITITSVWIVRHYSSTSNPVPFSTVEPVVSKRGDLPCVVSQGEISKVKDLLASGVNVDSTADSCINSEPSPRGVTLLMKSAGRGDTEMVKLLLENGANVNASDSWETTPLFSAMAYKHIDIMDLLLEKGANINAKPERGWTILMGAAVSGEPEIIEYLLNKGADINAQDKNGTTALMIAAGYKHPEAMQLLIKRGANPNLKDKAGRTASVYVKRGFPEEYIIAVM